MTRLRDVCWACDGEGFTINGDCKNCNASGMVMEDDYKLLPIEELMLNTIVGVDKWAVTHVEQLNRYYYEHNGESFMLRTWSVTSTYVCWTLFSENKEQGTSEAFRDGKWIYATAETGELCDDLH